MTAVSNEQGFENLSPSYIGSNFECDYEEYNYSRIAKAFIHIWIAPLILLAVFGSKVSFGNFIPLIYLTCVTFLYSTVFRKQSGEFFGALLFTVLMIGAFVAVV